MKPSLPSDVEIAKEALSVLMEHMPASKVARLLSALQIGDGDYLKLREELFAGETVESLFKKASEHQSENR
jgi:hypothetical protein